MRLKNIPSIIPAALFAAVIATPAMALEARECGQLAITMGEVERASGLCPAPDAEFFEQKTDELNTVAGNLCGQYDHDAMLQAALTGAELINSWKNRDGVQAMCARLRAVILEEETK